MSTQTQTRRIEPDITLVQIVGRLNLGAQLTQAEAEIKSMMDEGARKLIVDLAGLTNIDSCGVGMLIGLHTHMEQHGGKLRVAGANGPVAKIFNLVHMGRIVSLDANADASCQALGTGIAATS